MPGLPEKASSHNKKRAFMIEAIKKKRTWRPLAGAVIVISVAAIAGQSVLASLNATAFNTSAQNINAGTMKLKFDTTTTRTTFTQPITNLVPGDVVYRYITLENNGTIDGKDLKLSLGTAAGNTATLINDVGTSKALRLTVTSCPIAWTINNNIATCATPSEEISVRTIGSLSAPATFALNPILASTNSRYLQMKIELPDQNETTLNGALPANTIQGGSVDLTYTFDLAQRTAQPTNS